MKYLLIIIIAVFIISCKTESEQKDRDFTDVKQTETPAKQYKEIIIQNDTLIHMRYGCCFVVATRIMYPDEKAEGIILMLKPYDYDIDDWCFSTDFCEEALKRNYVLITPNFGNTIYQFRHYNETVFDVRKFPDLQWIVGSYIPDMQEMFGLLKPNQRNFVAGLSTGGRGAVLIANSMPEIFSGAASVSGYFNIAEYRNLSLFTDALGEYEIHKERWENENFLCNMQQHSVPLYIAHGQNDFAVKAFYSIQLVELIKNISDEVLIESHFPQGEMHGFVYWTKETSNILDFFDKL